MAANKKISTTICKMSVNVQLKYFSVFTHRNNFTLEINSVSEMLVFYCSNLFAFLLVP